MEAEVESRTREYRKRKNGELFGIIINLLPGLHEKKKLTTDKVRLVTKLKNQNIFIQNINHSFSLCY